MRSPGGRLDLFGCGITVSLARTFGVIFAIYLVLQVNVNIADAKVSTNTRMVVQRSKIFVMFIWRCKILFSEMCLLSFGNNPFFPIEMCLSQRNCYLHIPKISFWEPLQITFLLNIEVVYLSSLHERQLNRQNSENIFQDFSKK